MIKDLPHKIKGFTVTDGEDYITVFNSRYNYEQLQETAKHEAEHIREDDFFSDSSADSIEKKRHD